MEMIYDGLERRNFIRLDYRAPITYKICKEETINKLMQGYTADISQSGLLCNLKDRVNKDDILWLSFDKGTLSVLEEIEKRSLIYQSGIIGKVVRIEEKNDTTFDVGIQFITREEKKMSNICQGFQFAEKPLNRETK